MAGFFETLRGLGAAHAQHVQAITTAFQMPSLQAGREHLATYLQTLSEPALLGFRTSLGLLLTQEGNPQVQQALQWIAANADGLRAGHFAAVTPQSLPPHGLTLQQVTALITPWAELTAEQVRAPFTATMQVLDTRGRQEFAAHLDTLAQQVLLQIQQLQQQDDSGAWGNSYEDRLAYLQARISSGEPRRDSAAVQQQQAVLQALQQLATAARQWQGSAPAPAVSDASRMLGELQQQFQQAQTDMDPARTACCCCTAAESRRGSPLLMRACR